MQKEINILILIKSEHFVFFGKKTNDFLHYDAILSCNYFSERIDEFRGEQIFGFFQWEKFLIKNGDNKIHIFTFDYVPLPIFIALSKASKVVREDNLKISFIQHGIFENNKKEQIFPVRTKSWFFSTIYFVITFLLRNIKFSSNLKTIKEYAKKGGDQAIFNLIKEYPKIDNCFFWDAGSQKYFEKYEAAGQLFINKYIIGSPDIVTFKYAKNKIIFVVTQPLFQTGHCTLEEYKTMLLKISQKYGNDYNLKYILHPKIPKNILDETFESFYLTSDMEELLCEKVIGHFSSLLLRVPSTVEIIQYDGEIKKVEEANLLFKKNYLQENTGRKVEGSDFYTLIINNI